ncbi:nitrate reductase molybdenum cofactor assembly chaperone [Actinophytocola sp.]|uniref:nitrate reductase molybdenum cofactor assembly chaperone n=1 Tax=Actinophytocola sp. TaxID=1872138 RepID=UPI002D7F824C|nr:nitrate reductase molybdenum cofactor assembly chaperone [Actinophytocola sp.]HET9142338.1 nitrate reductase molybdenum cofactor assembly chaperone [Actinophytocola sp.]HEU5107896.1 nitrate reductase molybdenum cofactor assembly chaperone [Micromonosporaceae bacterium]
MTATSWQVQSLLLDYPDEALLRRVPLLRTAVATLPDAVGAPLPALLDHLESTPPTDLAAEYVATFDHRKQFSPYLTYFSYGDTRKRGMALLRFKHAYRAAGLVLDDAELPDHLAVVLEFAAIDPAAGRRLLIEYRAGLELLRLGLREAGSPWAAVPESVSATLPSLGRHDHDAVARLAAEGPPEEEVGLAPYGVFS